MSLGMGSVFVFLAVLIVSMSLTARLVRVIEQRRVNGGDTSASDRVAPSLNPDLIAAISVAIQRYRKTHRH